MTTRISTVLIGLALAGTAVDCAADPRRLGTQWEGKDGNARITQLGLDVEGPGDPDPALYRRPAFDWRRSQLQVGFYPKVSFAKGVEGTVRLAVDIDAIGRPLACRTIASSGATDLDAHACPHVLAHIRFVPTLPRDGIARAETLTVSLGYTLGPMMVNVAAGGGSPMPQPRRVEPIAPIDAKLLGIAGQAPPPDVTGIGVHLRVGADGTPTACLLREPTRDDAVDKRLCDALLERARFPAAPGSEPRDYHGWVSWGGR